MVKKWLITAFISSICLTGFGEEIAPYQFGLLGPELSWQPGTTRINGFVEGLWTENPQSALSVSLFNGSTGDSRGLAIGGIVNYSESYAGLQIAPLNTVYDEFVGLQVGVFNYVQECASGVQLGCYNVSKDMTGLQVGIMNVASNLYGVQIGLVNLNVSNAFLTKLPGELSPGMILLNWKF